MSEYVIMTDSACDLPANIAEELGLVVAPLTFIADGKEYKGYLDEREISFKDTYALIRNKATVSTAAANIDGNLELMDPILASGKDILCLSFSSGLSNTYNAAELAAKDMREKYPDRKIFVVDTLCASLGEGMLVYLAAKEKEKGKTIEEVRDYVEENKLHLCHWFTVDDLSCLKRGGRISTTSEIIGSVLKIKPVLHVDNDGHLINITKARGRKLALKALVDKIGETAYDPANQTMFISHGDCYDEAVALADEIKSKYGVKEIIIGYIGSVIGAHSGPGTMALFFLGSER